MTQEEIRLLSFMKKQVRKGCFEWSTNELSDALVMPRNKVDRLLAALVAREELGVRKRSSGAAYYYVDDLKKSKV